MADAAIKILRTGCLLCGLTALSVVPMSANSTYRPESVASDAPKETEQFSFLLGTWHCETRNMQPDGTLVAGANATWKGSLILGGWAIEDVWESHGPSGASSFGVNLRSFNRETGKWDNRWLAGGALQWKYYEAEKVGDTMVMTGGEGVDGAGRKFIDRNTFYDIDKDSWKWRKDRSFDGGHNWIEGVAHIDATRHEP